MRLLGIVWFGVGDCSFEFKVQSARSQFNQKIRKLEMQSSYKTERLLLEKLTLDDTEFISELVNTAEWIKFIGDRNIHTKEDAVAYITRLIYNPAIKYWVVKPKGQETSTGIITLIKRDYLEHHDIGFAFLPRYTKHGYAFEATMAVLNDLAKDDDQTCFLATTLKENMNSIHLLEKLGFNFDKEITVENEKLLLYSADSEKFLV